MSLEEFKSQNIVSSLVLYSLPQFYFLPVWESLLDIFSGLTTQTPARSHMAFFLLLLLCGWVTPPTRPKAINSLKPLQLLKPSMPQACTTSKLHLAKAVAALSAHDVTLHRRSLYWSGENTFLECPCLWLITWPTPPLELCIAHNLLSLHGDPASSHTLLPDSQK